MYRYNTRKRVKQLKAPAEEITDSDVENFRTEDLIPVRTLYVSGFGGISITVQTLMQSFLNDGPIKEVVIHESNVQYAFVTFADVKSALTAMKTPHILNGRRLILRPADSWHQPQKEAAAEEEAQEIDMNQSLLKLNDDCLFCIFTHFNIRELAVLEKVCTRFQNVAESIYKTQKVLDFDSLGTDITLMEVRHISAKLGPFVHTVKATSTSFNKINPRFLITILKNCKNLQHLSLEGFNINKQNCLKHLARTFTTLKTARLENCGIKDEISMCLRGASALEVLDLSQNSELIGQCLTVLRNITEMNLSYCQNLQPFHFVKFCEHNVTLRTLNIIRCDKINHTCFNTMSKFLENLENLMICNSYMNVNSGDYVILADLSKLTHLQINYNNFLNVDSFLARVSEKNRLEFLDISSGHLTRNTSRALANFTKLKILKLNYKIECSDDTLMQIACNNTLQELHIVGCTSITNEGLVAFIRKCNVLRFINVSGCYGITNDLLVNLLPYVADRAESLEIVVGGTQIARIEDIVNLLEVPKLKINYDSTADSFCAIDDWEDMFFGDDDDLDEIDDFDIDDDDYPFFYDNDYDGSDYDDEIFF
ncbi:hypothetical protein DMENIID0001_032110 [Sergentomyia squamirostris]